MAPGLTKKIFAKQFIYFINGTQKSTTTNHYILFTNVSIKICIRPGSEPGSSGGGEEFQPDKYLTDRNFVIQVMSMTYYVDLVTY